MNGRDNRLEGMVSMRLLTRALTKRICDEATALRVALVLCHLASPTFLAVALYGISRQCTTRAEILIGTLAAVSGALSLATAGLVLGVMAELRRR
jgi:hypothetical protein